ncbi:MAG: FtsW/RodA/SpoVE family cell cycle protein [Planctomycetota bacterium]
MKHWTRIFQPRSARDDAYVVLAAALGLVAFGLICLYSLGEHLLVRQALCAAFAVLCCMAVIRVPSETLQKAAVPLVVLTGALLLGCLLFATPVANTKRWFPVPFLGRFQPSELAKLAIVIFLAHRLSLTRGRIENPVQLSWPVWLLCLLVLPAPDFGTTIFLATVAGTMMLIAGVRVGRLLGISFVAAPLLFLVASRFPYIQERLRFFHGEKSYQQLQAEIALGSGGLFGSGLGAGWQKHHYLPAGHTDFILANIGEELGFLGVCIIIALFLLILIHGVRVALAAARKNRFGFHLAAGATFVIVFQALLNIAVATGAAPTKGISLPFLSQGGSNMVISLLAVGLIVNVGRNLESSPGGLAGTEFAQA